MTLHPRSHLVPLIAILLLVPTGCGRDKTAKKAGKPLVAEVSHEYGPQPHVGEPNATKSVTNHPVVVGWPPEKSPTVPEGFTIVRWAEQLDYPRNAYVLPNGDVVVAEARTQTSMLKEIGDLAQSQGQKKSKALGKSANRITLFRDADRDGRPELRETFLSDLRQPFGMLVIGDYFYVANTDGVVRYPYAVGQTKIKGKGHQILSLPADGYNNHWTRNLLASPDGKKIYITVGSGTGDKEGYNGDDRRAAILECNPDGSGMRIFAGGLRNPVTMAWEPTTQALWAVVNERDELGDELVPDYLTSVQQGGFYGWPYAYFGPNPDPRHVGARDDLVAKTIRPDYALGSHTASLGLTFSTGNAFPPAYRSGAFIGQHGSWNRSQFVGYKVVFIPFENGRPSGPPQDFVTGFIADAPNVYGRPCGVTFLPDGSLLVMDDAADTIWRVSADPPAQQADARE